MAWTTWRLVTQSHNKCTILFVRNFFFLSLSVDQMTMCLFFPLVMELLVSLVFQMTSEFVYQVIAKSQVKDILLYCISRLFNYLQTSIKSQTCNFVSCFVYSSLQQCMTLPFIGRKILNWVISFNHNSGTQTCMLLKSPVDAGTMVCYKGNFTIKISMWFIYGGREILQRLH